MKTVGEILKSERLKKNKSLLQLHRETKIPQRFLVALEANDFSTLPPDTFVKGFIKIYSQALGLSASQLLAVYRRDREGQEQKEILPPSLSEDAIQKKWHWTPKLTAIIGISMAIVLFLSYLGWQIWSFLAPPKLIVERPVDNQIIKEESTEVVGQTNKDASVYVNDQLVNITNQGKFTYTIKLFPGENRLVITAVNRRGVKTTIECKVQVDKVN